jgi:hypothetical protein
MPPAGPAVATQAIAAGPHEIGTEWIIVAVRPVGKGVWEPTMPYEEWRVFKTMVDDNAATTTQRRDQARTVLLAKLKEINHG